MDKDVVDTVNALLKLGVGEVYRLEHIKQAYMLNKTIWKSDERYLEQMREKYLVKHGVESDIPPENNENSESESNMIHCWKCGKKSLFEANFCMVCGSALFDVGTESEPAEVKVPTMKKPTKPIGLKIPIMIGIPVLILIILGVGYSQGVFDTSPSQVMDNSVDDEIESTDKEISPTESNSKCGPGTIFDEDTNSCVLD